MPAVSPEDPRRAAEIEAHIRAELREQGSVLVALSGGVDSSLLAALAAQELGSRAVAATGVSASLHGADLALVEDFCRSLGIRHVSVETDELSIPAYVENSPDRCYFCKNELFAKLVEIAAAHDLARIVDGTTREDLDGHRPGYLAAIESDVLSPLVNAGANKRDVRRMASRLELPNAAKVSSPCLSSRIAYGTRVTAERLARVGAAEDCLRSLGFSNVRVRLHDTIARVEVPKDELSLAVEHAGEISSTLRSLGFNYVTIDLEGLRSGSLLEVINKRAGPGRQ